ncbi:MAG: hypothetical protein IPI60_07035 [Saprospiraceae bacterium]|nr:hypothetical protein [Saprospiraceae bacterium]
MIHGLKLPVSGLVVGGAAVCCISMIAWHTQSRKAILQATIVVAIFKMMLSPHSPPPAYIAVFFQGWMGALLFSERKHFALSCVLLGIIALFESAIQRILVLTFLYGVAFWETIDIFVSKVTGAKEVTPFSKFLAIAYILMHIVVGWIIGIIANRMVKFVFLRPRNLPKEAILKNGVFQPEMEIPQKKKSWFPFKKSLLFIWIFLVVLSVQSLLFPENPWISTGSVGMILLRSFLIILSWYFLLKPLFQYILRTYLNKQSGKYKEIIEEIQALLPALRQIWTSSWQQSRHLSGMKRWKMFVSSVLLRSLYE